MTRADVSKASAPKVVPPVPDEMERLSKGRFRYGVNKKTGYRQIIEVATGKPYDVEDVPAAYRGRMRRIIAEYDRRDERMRVKEIVF